jgi:putative monooxygenase
MPKRDEEMARVIRPFSDAKAFWLGDDGTRRKVFKIVDRETGGTSFTSGLTIFEPGEESSFHVHPESEEINFIARGAGELVREDGERIPFQQNDFMFMPKGARHQHVNTGDEPLWLIWAYSPPASLPED